MRNRNLFLAILLLSTTPFTAIAQKKNVSDVVEEYKHVFEWKIQPKYYVLENSNRNILAAAMKVYKYGYIDIDENEIVPLKWGYISSLDEYGFGVVGKSDDNWKYYLDLKKGGEKAFEGKFQHATTFSDGYAIVGTPGKSKYGVIDTTGKFVIPYKFAKIWRPSNFGDILRGESDDYIPARKFTNMAFGMDGYINRKGEWVKEPTWANTTPKLNGLYLVQTGKWKKGLLDSKLNEIVPAKYDYLVSKRSCIIALLDGKWGFLTKDGKEALAPQFDYLSTYDEGGKFYFEKKGIYGYVHVDGFKVEYLDKLDRDPLGSYIPLPTKEKGELLLFWEGDNYGLAKVNNGNFEELLPAKYSKIRLTSINGKEYLKLFYKQKKKEYCGLCTLDMKMLIDPEKMQFTLIDNTNSSGYAVIAIHKKYGLAKFKL